MRCILVPRWHRVTFGHDMCNVYTKRATCMHVPHLPGNNSAEDCEVPLVNKLLDSHVAPSAHRIIVSAQKKGWPMPESQSKEAVSPLQTPLHPQQTQRPLRSLRHRPIATRQSSRAAHTCMRNHSSLLTSPSLLH